MHNHSTPVLLLILTLSTSSRSLCTNHEQPCSVESFSDGHLDRKTILVKFLKENFLLVAATSSGSETSFSTVLLHTNTWSGLSIHRSCACCHNYCELMRVTSLLCPENTFLVGRLHFWLLPSFCSRFHNDSWASGGRSCMQNSTPDGSRAST